MPVQAMYVCTAPVWSLVGGTPYILTSFIPTEQLMVVHEFLDFLPFPIGPSIFCDYCAHVTGALRFQSLELMVVTEL